MVGWLHLVGLEERQNIMVVRVWWWRLFTSWQPASKKREREKDRKGLGTRHIFPRHMPRDPLYPANTCLPLMPSYYKTMKGSLRIKNVIHWQPRPQHRKLQRTLQIQTLTILDS
jgi:hypothetical protein